MKISLTDAGKRFNREWIFRHLSYTFEEGKSYAIVGPNGSGKSTLLQVLSGAMQVSEGEVKYEIQSTKYEVKKSENSILLLNTESVFNYISICAPYLEVVEEMTLVEFLNFHRQFKPFLKGMTIEKTISLLGLENAAQKQIRNFSSGMKQRVKLAQCIFSDTPIVLLDEPCTNFDKSGVELYHQLVNDYCNKRMVIVSSNDQQEYSFCKETLNIMDWK